MKKKSKDIMYIYLYADDNLMVRKPEAINEAIEALQKYGLVIKIMGGLQNYLSLEVKFS